MRDWSRGLRGAARLVARLGDGVEDPVDEFPLAVLRSEKAYLRPRVTGGRRRRCVGSGRAVRSVAAADHSGVGEDTEVALDGAGGPVDGTADFSHRHRNKNRSVFVVSVERVETRSELRRPTINPHDRTHTTPPSPGAAQHRAAPNGDPHQPAANPPLDRSGR